MGREQRPRGPARLLAAAVPAARGGRRGLRRRAGGAGAPTQAAPEAARRALEQAGFSVIGTAPFRAEGERKGFWYGLSHDAVIRIRPGRTDVRVTAREARADGGEACRLASELARALAADQSTGR